MSFILLKFVSLEYISEWERHRPHNQSLTLTRLVIRRSLLTVLAIGATLAHTQTFCAREPRAAIIRTWRTLARVKLGCIFLKCFPEVVPFRQCTWDVSDQVGDGGKLRTRNRERWSHFLMGIILPPLSSSL